MKPVNPTQIPLHRAPFYFAPDFIPTREKWIEIFSSLLTKVGESAGRTVKVSAGDGYQVEADIGLLRFTIDAEGGMFGVQKISDDDWDPDAFYLTEVPATFVKQLGSKRVPDHVRHDTEVIKKISDWLLRSMNLRLNEAVRSGRAYYRGRETELGGFVTLDVEQFALFDIDEKAREEFCAPDDNLDTATARFSGTKLYCVCVARTAEAPAPFVVVDVKGRRGPGRSPTVNHQLVDQEMLELIQSRGIPDRTKPNWTNSIFVDAVIERLAVQGVKVGKTTVSQKIRPLIQQLRKAKSGRHLRKLSISEIH